MSSETDLKKAFTAHAAGHLDEAAAACLEVLASAPTNAVGLNLLGVIRTQQGNVAESVALFARATECEPRFAEAFRNLGLAFAQCGETDKAVAALRAALGAQSDYAAASHDLASLLQLLGRFDEAVAVARELVARRPDDAGAYHQLAVVLTAGNQLADAAAASQRATELAPESAEVFNHLGAIYRAQCDLPKAEQAFRRARELAPALPGSHFNLGLVLVNQGRETEALDCLQETIAQAPSFAPAHALLGKIRLARGEAAAAAAAAEQAISLDPAPDEPYFTLGSAYYRMKDFGKSAAAFDAAIERNPKHLSALNSRGWLWHEQNEFGRALACYHDALRWNPDFAAARWNRALARLVVGDFAGGWEDYESRFTVAGGRTFTAPRWQREPLQGRSILLHAEQGLGDTIQFGRYVTEIAKQGATVYLDIQPELKTLLGSLAGVTCVLSQGETLPWFDFHCPLLSVPGVLGTDLSSIPNQVPYLRAPAADSRYWENRLASDQRPRVGLVWAGNPKQSNDHNRSLPLDLLAPLLAQKGVSFYSLQKEASAADRAALQRAGVVDLSPELADLAQTAGIVENLDLVLTVDTAVAHLAGALAVPTWLLVSFTPDWRWLLEREDSPWYPTMRLFRQAEKGNWGPVISKVAVEMVRRFSHRA